MTIKAASERHAKTSEEFLDSIEAEGRVERPNKITRLGAIFFGRRKHGGKNLINDAREDVFGVGHATDGLDLVPFLFRKPTHCWIGCSFLIPQSVDPWPDIEPCNTR